MLLALASPAFTSSEALAADPPRIERGLSNSDGKFGKKFCPQTGQWVPTFETCPVSETSKPSPTSPRPNPVDPQLEAERHRRIMRDADERQAEWERKERETQTKADEGWKYYLGKGVPEDLNRAFVLLFDACHAPGGGSGCAGAARIILERPDQAWREFERDGRRFFQSFGYHDALGMAKLGCEVGGDKGSCLMWCVVSLEANIPPLCDNPSPRIKPRVEDYRAALKDFRSKTRYPLPLPAGRVAAANDLAARARELRTPVPVPAPAAATAPASDARDPARELLRAVQREPAKALLRYMLAEHYLAQGDAAKALPEAERATQLEPAKTVHWRALAKAQMRLHRWDDAAQALQKAVVLQPAESQTWDLLLDLHANPEYPQRDARALLDQAVARYPTNGHLWFRRGGLALARGDRVEALASYRQGVAVRPDFYVEGKIGLMECEAGRAREAMAAFDSAFAKSPANDLLLRDYNLCRTRLGLQPASAYAPAQALAPR